MEEQTDKKLSEEFAPVMCQWCGLDLDIHEGDGFCPGGTEEAGGRR